MNTIKNVLCLATFVFLSNMLVAQSLDRVEPPFWWTGMKNPELQLMVYSENVADLSVAIEDYDGVELRQVTRLQSPNYLVIDLRLSPDVKPGSFEISFNRGRRTLYSYDYELNEREEGSADRAGFNTSDVMYLITPDRFANGNPDNDTIDGLKEAANRENIGGRHGGDIRGIIDNLDYIGDMGFTAIWVNPVLENDMERYSYHGYSTTDFYKVDSRFGSNEEYRELGLKAKEKGIKMIMDMIVNHNGSEHWWMKDLPTSDWVNFQDEYLRGEYRITSHRKATIQDPYVSQTDLSDFVDGWFVTTMPDLNQRNPYMAKYLIQNTIWWIEYAGLDGIRMDTYPYPGKEFMTDWTCQVMNEYPNFNIVGEEWHGNPSIVAHWQRGKENPNGYTSCLPSLMDFPLQEKLTKALNDKQTRWSGWLSAYETLANDFVYADPFNLVVFPDNHDMSRFFTQVNENYNLFRLGIAYYMTIRGIPQIYYGTEILMNNPGTTDHGIIRSDFPGGWSRDEINGFTGAGLSEQQNDAQAFMKKLLNWRKGNTVVHNGGLLHYNPKDGIYVLFRMNEEGKVMTVLSKNENDFELDLSRFSEGLGDATSGYEVISDNDVSLETTLMVPAMSPMIIEIR